MHLPLSFYEVLRNKITISSVVKSKVNLSRRGHELIGLCPFHTEKTPSFKVYDNKQSYYCFGCHTHGDVIKFVSETGGFSYSDAAIKLAKDYNIELPTLSDAEVKQLQAQDQHYGILELAKNFFQAQMTEMAVKYLENRGFDKNIIEKFNLGFSHKKSSIVKYFNNKDISLKALIEAGLIREGKFGPYNFFDDLIIFPILNTYSKVVGFGGRVLDNRLPKYKNSAESIVFRKKELLYGEDKALSHIYKNKNAILVEGYLDVISLHQFGYNQAVASLGTAVSDKHLIKLWRMDDKMEIILCLDSDAAGKRATLKVIKMALPMTTAAKALSFIIMPKGEDPDSMLHSGNKALFDKLYKDRLELSKMLWHLETDSIDLNSQQAKTLAKSNLKKYSATIPDSELRGEWNTFFNAQFYEFKQKDYQQKQTTSSSKNKKATKKNALSVIDYHSAPIVELAIMSALTRWPELLLIEDIENFVYKVTFESKNLAEFCDFLYENKEINKEALAHKIEKSGFYELFSLLSNQNSGYLCISLTKKDKDIDYLMAWNFTYLRYQLESIIKEKDEVLYHIYKNSTDNDLYKSKNTQYQRMINEISKKMNELIEKINESN